MKSILEALFMGDIDVVELLAERERIPISGSEAFIKTLSPEQQGKYEDIFNDFMKQWTLDNQASFVIGFKMAVRMILEAIAE